MNLMAEEDEEDDCEHCAENVAKDRDLHPHVITG